MMANQPARGPFVKRVRGGCHSPTSGLSGLSTGESPLLRPEDDHKLRRLTCAEDSTPANKQRGDSTARHEPVLTVGGRGGTFLHFQLMTHLHQHIFLPRLLIGPRMTKSSEARRAKHQHAIVTAHSAVNAQRTIQGEVGEKRPRGEDSRG